MIKANCNKPAVQVRSFYPAFYKKRAAGGRKKGKLVIILLCEIPGEVKSPGTLLLKYKEGILS